MASSWAAPGEDASSALALANTLQSGPSGPVDLLTEPGRAQRWLAGRAPGADRPPSPSVLNGLLELRSAARELLDARAAGRDPEPASVRTVNTFAGLSPSTRVLVWPAGAPPRVEDREPGTPYDAALSRIAGDAISLITGPLAAGLHRCEARGCVRLLIKDHPRRRWCSTRCGNRMRAADHYARRASR